MYFDGENSKPEFLWLLKCQVGQKKLPHLFLHVILLLITVQFSVYFFWQEYLVLNNHFYFYFFPYNLEDNAFKKKQKIKFKACSRDGGHHRKVVFWLFKISLPSVICARQINLGY